VWNRNQPGVGPSEPDEPVGWYDPSSDGYPDPVVVSEGQPVTGVDIILRHPFPHVYLPVALDAYRP